MSQATEGHLAAAQRPNELNLVWIDMEMTGLDPDKDKIIELRASSVPDKPATSRG